MFCITSETEGEVVHVKLVLVLLWFSVASSMLFSKFGCSIYFYLSRNTLYLLSHRLCFFIVLKRDLFVCCDDSLASCEPNNQLNVLYHFRN